MSSPSSVHPNPAVTETQTDYSCRQRTAWQGAKQGNKGRKTAVVGLLICPEWVGQVTVTDHLTARIRTETPAIYR